MIEQDPFENFDSCILLSPSKNSTQKIDSPQKNETAKTPPSATKLTEKIEMIRSQEIRSTITAELRKQKSDIRSEFRRINNTDKVFKWKLNEVIPCKKLGEKLNVTKVIITGHEMVHRTLLPDYVIYHIAVKPSKIFCKRTYDNFLELSKVLSKMYPGVKVPSLDSGSWFS